MVARWAAWGLRARLGSVGQQLGLCGAEREHRLGMGAAGSPRWERAGAGGSGGRCPDPTCPSCRCRMPGWDAAGAGVQRGGGAGCSLPAEAGAGAAARPGQTSGGRAEGTAPSGPAHPSRCRPPSGVGAEPCPAAPAAAARRDATPGVPSPLPPGASAEQPGVTLGPSPSRHPAPDAAPGTPAAGRGLRTTGRRRGRATRGSGGLEEHLGGRGAGDGAGQALADAQPWRQNPLWGSLRLFPAWRDRGACGKRRVCCSAPLGRVFKRQNLVLRQSWFVPEPWPSRCSPSRRDAAGAGVEQAALGVTVRRSPSCWSRAGGKQEGHGSAVASEERAFSPVSGLGQFGDDPDLGSRR